MSIEGYRKLVVFQTDGGSTDGTRLVEKQKSTSKKDEKEKQKRLDEQRQKMKEAAAKFETNGRPMGSSVDD